MSLSVSRVFEAAGSGGSFTVQNCREIDKLVRNGSNDFRDFPELGEGQLRELRRCLNLIDNWYCTQAAVGLPRPPKARLERLQKIEKNALEILELLELDPHARPRDMSFEHLNVGGIFEGSYNEFEPFSFEPLVEALQMIALHAREAIDRLKKNGIEARRRSPDLVRYRLYADLGKVYQDRWGRGSLPTSVNENKGGPAIRYFEFTLHRILGEPVKPQAIKDAMEKIKGGAIDLTDMPSFFSTERVGEFSSR